jgi:signal transduction histidine kinase
LSDGVVSIDPHNILENRMPPPVIIEGALVDGERVRPEPGLRLPARVHSLRINYTALSFVVPERVRFHVKLEGFDTEWVDAGARREAVYTTLEPKRYRFRVMACNNEGVWNEKGATWEFSVRPAFSQTYWFLALSIAAGALVLWALYKRRVRLATQLIQSRYEERLAERTRIARELHDTLLQSLAGASLQLSAISNIMTAAPDEARKKVDSIRQQMNAAFREARRKVWDLRSPALEGRDLPAALRESLEMTTGGMPGCRLTVTGEPRHFPPHVEEQLLRIGQECVANALRHAEAGKIAVELRYETEHLVLCVSDDGKGFDVDAASRLDGHWGLRNMQERANEIGARWKIVSTPGHGTTTETVVPSASNGKNGR